MNRSGMVRSGWIAGAVALGLVLGVGSAALLLKHGHEIGPDGGDGWLGNRGVGATDADPWTRAVIARIGLLALNRSETIYFSRYRDAEGRPFDEGCDYELMGTDLPARWWSITVYDADDFLPRNADGALSVDATRVVREADGRWRARLSPRRGAAANWLSSRAAGRFNLSLRLYTPDPSALADAASIPFPAVRRLGCEGDES